MTAKCPKCGVLIKSLEAYNYRCPNPLCNADLSDLKKDKDSGEKKEKG